MITKSMSFPNRENTIEREFLSIVMDVEDISVHISDKSKPRYSSVYVPVDFCRFSANVGSSEINFSTVGMKSCDMMVIAITPNIRAMITVIAEASPRGIFTSNLLTIGSKRSIKRLDMKNMKANVGKNQKKDKSAIVENAKKNDVLYLYHK